MAAWEFRLTITAEDWIRYYTGGARYVVARAEDGRTVRFAARHLQRHVTHDGVRGRFRITTDAENNFVSLERLADSSGSPAGR